MHISLKIFHFLSVDFVYNGIPHILNCIFQAMFSHILLHCTFIMDEGGSQPRFRWQMMISFDCLVLLCFQIIFNKILKRF